METHRALFYLSGIPALSASCFVAAKFDEPAFNFTVHCRTDKPAFLGRTIVVRTHTRAAFIGGDDRLLEGTLGEPVKVAAEDGLKVQSITALKQVVGVERPGDDGVAQWEMSKQDGRATQVEFGQVLIEPGKSRG